MPLTESPSTCSRKRREVQDQLLAPSAKPPPLRFPAPDQSLYLGHSKDCHSEDKWERPSEQVKVGCLARQRLIGGTQGFEGGVPGIGEDHKPDDTSHQGIVHDDKDDDTGQGLVGAAQTWGVSLAEHILYFLTNFLHPVPRPLNSAV